MQNILQNIIPKGLFLFLSLLFFVPLARAQDILDIKQYLHLEELGDATIKADFKWSPETYLAIKQRFPTPELFISRFLSPDRFEAEPRHIKASYNDSFYKTHVEMELLGLSKNHGFFWSVEVGSENETINPLEISAKKAVFESVEKTGDLIMRIETIITLPPDASQVSFDSDTRHLRYTLPAREYTGKNVSIKTIIRRKKRLMSAIYKLYSHEDFINLWTAKVLFTNDGDVPLREFHIKFSLGDYSDGYSETCETALFLPGQSIVEIYRPIMSKVCTQIQSASPVKMRIHYSYILPNGKTKEKEVIRRVEILGNKDFVFTDLPQKEIKNFSDMFNNADYITAWVTSYDPVVCEFGGMANELAQGAGAAVDDEQAAIVSAAIYELMRYNKITYQSPAGLFQSDQIQRLKYPRNTLRDRSGTCIDLAIAFSAFAEAQGLNPVLFLIPGHCFPGIFLPKSGNILPIEMTLLGGGTADSSQPFEKAVEVGTKELEEAITKGNILFIHIGPLKQKGITPPELPSLPADILSKWRIRPMEHAAREKKQTAQTSPQWVQWVHPQKTFSVPCPNNFDFAIADEFTTNLISPDQTFLFQILIIPKNYQGNKIGEAQMSELFASIKGELSHEESRISAPNPIKRKDNTPGLSREYFLKFTDGNSLSAFAIYFDGGSTNLLLGGCFMNKTALETYGDIYSHMIENIQFAYQIQESDNNTISPPSSQQDSFEDSLNELGRAFDELLDAL